MQYNLSDSRIIALKNYLIAANRSGRLLSEEQVNFLLDTCTTDELAYAITHV